MGPRFVVDGEVVELGAVDPTGSVLDLLRYRLRRTGTKEGCAEGDCGACTVLLGELTPDKEGVAWRAVNACILFTLMLDGRALMTVESLGRDGAPAPVQQAFVDRHASQCGFCTPGFVMSLHGRSLGAEGADATVCDVIAGNLCRCTGYGPILAAGEALAPASRDDRPTAALLRAIRRQASLAYAWDDPVAGLMRRWWAPRSLDELAQLRLQHPDARLLAGGTDVGLWVTKQMRTLPDVIWLGEVEELKRLDETADGVSVGAGVTYTRARDVLAGLHPELADLVRRIGGLQVRNAGTVGGNIANGSPIGDMPPALIALDATLVLRRGSERRFVPLEDYFLSYGVQDLSPGEFVERIDVPRPAADDLIRITKLSKRLESDISAVCAALRLTVREGVVADARLAFGGMAETPKRARTAEAALVGRPWSEDAAHAAAEALAEDFTPLSDLRGSAAYRLRAAGNLLRRLWLETSAPEASVRLDALVDG